MSWKYFKLALLLLLLFLISVPAYRYFGSIDWAKKHSAKIAALPVLKATDNTGLFRLPVGDFEFLVRVAGLQNEGPAVLLLHGFPESSIMWTDLLEKGAKEGYRVVAFDQRGYSPRARPKGIENYHISHLTQDVLNVAHQLGLDTFHLVGHDWGAVVGWNVAMTSPERLHSWTALSIPHSGVFFDAILNDPAQQLRSSYMKSLQKPFLPEYKFTANQQRFYKKLMGGSPKAFLAEYLALQAEFGATTATINWYRALDINEIVANRTYEKTVSRPTLFIWGTADMVIAPAIIPRQNKLISAPYKEVTLSAGHGLIQMEPDTVISEILAHFKRN